MGSSTAVLRNTRQRRAIRDAFETSGRPLAAEEVQKLASEGVSGLGIATVYRNIRTLVDEGWLVPVELPGENPRYELAGKGHHHHFHCRACGKVFELEGCVPTVAALAPKGFQVTDHEVVLYGACVACA
jgi:Fur family transcriptional regulator, ferric uptake regulator